MNKYDLTWYIVGPMAGLPDNNRPAFMEAANILWAAGFRNVINPAHFAKQPHWQIADYLRRDAAIFVSGAVNGIVLLPGWQDCEDAKVEVDVAQAMGLAVRELNELVG